LGIVLVACCLPVGGLRMTKDKSRKKVPKMPGAAKKDTREEKLAAARDLSEKITAKTKAAGITHHDLEKQAYKAFLNVKRNRRSGRS